MAFYKCEVLNELGQKKYLIKEAVDEISLRAFLKHDNYILLKSTMIIEKDPNVFFSVSSKVKISEVVIFLRQFSVMVNASISISESLNALKSQKFTKAFQKVLKTVYTDILSGKLLSEAFAKHPKVFPHFFVEMVAIGEVSGSLDTVLSSMANYYEKDQKIKKKAKSALVYPIILLSLILIVVIFMSLVILPQFAQMFKDFGGDIPGITKVILSISTFIKDYIIFIFLGLVIFIFFTVVFFKSKVGKKVGDRLKLKLPFIRTITRNLITSRFTSAFIILLKSGMNITDCMQNLVRILNNDAFSEKFRYSIEEVKRGKRIAKSIENTNIFPKMLTEMINVGEKSGNLEEVLESTSSFFETQVESSIQKATSALEPIMIVLLGAVVAVVLISVYLPMIDLMNQI